MSIIGYMQTISDVGMILKNRVITHGVDKKICAVALVAASPSVTSSVFYAELQKNFGTVWLTFSHHSVTWSSQRCSNPLMSQMRMSELLRRKATTCMGISIFHQECLIVSVQAGRGLCMKRREPKVFVCW